MALFSSLHLCDYCTYFIIIIASSFFIFVAGSRGGSKRWNGIKCGSQLAGRPSCSAVPWTHHPNAQCTRSADKVGLWRQHVEYDERLSRQGALLPNGGDYRAESQQFKTVSNQSRQRLWMTFSLLTMSLITISAWALRWERLAPTVMNPYTTRQKWQVNMHPQSAEMPVRSRWLLSTMRYGMQPMDL